MWITAEATFEPDAVDITTSKVYNYVRRNIREEQRENEEGNSYTVWVYEEMRVAKDEWELYKSAERNTANIDYIAMMSDIEIEEDVEDE